MKPGLAVLCVAVSIYGAPVHLVAQARPDSAPASALEAPRVFIDCQQMFCDLDFFRTEITWVNHVRDRAVADAHVLVTRQTTGGGGTEYTLAFLGLRQYAGVSDTLRWVAPPAAADDAVRRGLVSTLRAGLVRYAARAGQADRVQITLRAPTAQESQQAPVPQHDPWNFWVFRVRANGYTNGESQSKGFSGFGSLSANRITDAWKTTVALNGSYDESEFTFGSGRSVTNYRNAYGANALVVKSLGDHWSAGATVVASSSTFLNQQLVLSAAPAVEFNVFPYAQSTRRQLTARYGAGVRAFNYREETIFDRTQETRPYHELVVAVEARQPWGSVSAALNGSQFFHDPSKVSVGLFNSADFRIARGLAFNISGSASLVRDQLYLPKRGATDEEVLLRRQQLATSYRYFVSAGLSYTFGSIYNNIVNPRFGGGGGGGGFIMF